MNYVYVDKNMPGHTSADRPIGEKQSWFIDIVFTFEFTIYRKHSISIFIIKYKKKLKKEAQIIISVHNEYFIKGVDLVGISEKRKFSQIKMKLCFSSS